MNDRVLDNIPFQVHVVSVFSKYLTITECHYIRFPDAEYSGWEADQNAHKLRVARRVWARSNGKAVSFLAQSYIGWQERYKGVLVTPDLAVGSPLTTSREVVIVTDHKRVKLDSSITNTYVLVPVDMLYPLETDADLDIASSS